LKALIVNCRRNGLAVARSLGKMGVDVIAADHHRTAPGLYSKYVKERYLIPPPSPSNNDFVNELVKIGQNHSKTDEPFFLIPVNDEYVLTMAQDWNLLVPYFLPIFETDVTILKKCLNKNETYDLACNCGVPAPQSWINESVEKIENEGNFPFVVKPVSKRSPENIEKDIFKIRFCTDVEALRNAVTELNQKKVKYIVQEYIPGPDSALYTAGIFAWDGQLVAGFTGRKLRQFPPTTGEASFAEIVDEPVLLEYSRSLVQDIEFTGIAQIEFKKHNGSFYLMEVNPRSWSWNALSNQAGVNLPWIGCQTIKDQQAHNDSQSNNSGTWHYLFMDIFFNGIKSRNTSILRIFRDCWQADVHAFWNIQDPLPSLIAFLHTVKLTLRFLKRLVARPFQ